MKALLLKDLYDNKPSRYLYIVMFSIGFAMIFNEHHNYMYLFLLNLLMLLDIRMTFFNNNKVKWNMYVKTLPVSSKDIVISQYLTFLLNILLSVFTFALVSMFYGLSGEINWMSILNDAMILLAMNLFLQSITCLIFYANNDKQSTIYFAIVNAIFLVEFILHGDRLALNGFIFTTPGLICSLASLIFYTISMFVSVKLYDNHSRSIIEADA